MFCLKMRKYEGAIIKLSKNFSNISLLKDNIIVAGSAVLDKTISEYAMQNGIGGFEFFILHSRYCWRWN